MAKLKPVPGSVLNAWNRLGHDRDKILRQSPLLSKRLGERVALFTWRFKFAAAVSPSIPFFLSAPRYPPARSAPHYLNVKNRQISVKSPETWVFFARPHNNPSHSTLEKVYLFWKVLQPRPLGFSLHSKRFRVSSSRKLGREQKKKGNEGGGGRERLSRKPHDFEKLRSPTNAAFDWCGAGSVD